MFSELAQHTPHLYTKEDKSGKGKGKQKGGKKAGPGDVKKDSDAKKKEKDDAAAMTKFAKAAAAAKPPSFSIVKVRRCRLTSG